MKTRLAPGEYPGAAAGRAARRTSASIEKTVTRDRRARKRPSRCRYLPKTCRGRPVRADTGSWHRSSVAAPRPAARRSSTWPIRRSCRRSRRSRAVGRRCGTGQVARRSRRSHAGHLRPETPTTREVILVSKTPAAPAVRQRLRNWPAASRAERRRCFSRRRSSSRATSRWAGCRWRTRARPVPIRGWLYLKDEWAKRHPIFDGLPSGGLMDYTFYREIIPDLVLSGQDPPAEAVAGAIKASQDYSSGLMLAVHEFGAGRFILNTLLIRENLGATSRRRPIAAEPAALRRARHRQAGGRPPSRLRVPAPTDRIQVNRPARPCIGRRRPLLSRRQPHATIAGDATKSAKWICRQRLGC